MSKPLDDVAEFRLGKMLDQKKNKGDLMPYLANVNVRWGEFDLSNLREMRFEDNELDAFGLKYRRHCHVRRGRAEPVCNLERAIAQNDDSKGDSPYWRSPKC